jgi:hypothetical protein
MVDKRAARIRATAGISDASLDRADMIWDAMSRLVSIVQLGAFFAKWAGECRKVVIVWRAGDPSPIGNWEEGLKEALAYRS